MAKRAAMLSRDARAVPIHLLARLYLIVRADLDSELQRRAAKSLSNQTGSDRRSHSSTLPRERRRGRGDPTGVEPIRRTVDAPSFFPPLKDCLSTNELLIKGVRCDGKTFRPSDWAERLCGAATLFFRDTISSPRVQFNARPYHGYSSYIRPAIVGGIYCVIIDTRLRDLEPLAWNYITSFARDNDLMVPLMLPEMVPTPG